MQLRGAVDIPADLDVAGERLIDPVIGVVTSLREVPRDAWNRRCPSWRAPRSRTTGTCRRDADPFTVASGKGMTRGAARLSAIGEAVERYGASPWDPARVVRAAADDLPAPVLSPDDLVTYRDDQYRSLPYARWHPRLVTDSVEARRLVPAAAADPTATRSLCRRSAPSWTGRFLGTTSSSTRSPPTVWLRAAPWPWRSGTRCSSSSRGMRSCWRGSAGGPGSPSTPRASGTRTCGPSPSRTGAAAWTCTWSCCRRRPPRRSPSPSPSTAGRAGSAGGGGRPRRRPAAGTCLPQGGTRGGAGPAGTPGAHAGPDTQVRLREIVSDPGLVTELDDHDLLFADPSQLPRLEFWLTAPTAPLPRPVWRGQSRRAARGHRRRPRGRWRPGRLRQSHSARSCRSGTVRLRAHAPGLQPSISAPPKPGSVTRGSAGCSGIRSSSIPIRWHEFSTRRTPSWRPPGGVAVPPQHLAVAAQHAGCRPGRRGHPAGAEGAPVGAVVPFPAAACPVAGGPPWTT